MSIPGVKLKQGDIKYFIKNKKGCAGLMVGYRLKAPNPHFEGYCAMSCLEKVSYIASLSLLSLSISSFLVFLPVKP